MRPRCTKRKGFWIFSAQCGTGWQIGNTLPPCIYTTISITYWAKPRQLQCWYAKTRNFVMAELTKNPRLNEAKSKAESKAKS
jgi:hypothetical protein